VKLQDEPQGRIAPAVEVAERPAPELDEPDGQEDAWDRVGRSIERLMPAEMHVRLLWLLLLGSGLLRLLWLNRPEGGLIFDEKYYVNAARMIAGIAPQQDMYQDRPLGLDPNTEHPPLAKLMVAASILVLGDNAYGWRIPSVIFGTVSIWLMYAITRRAGASPYSALLAATLLAFDNLVFVHSRIFTLDIFQVAFMLLGLYLYISGRATLAGAGFALAALCKIGGAFGLLAVLGYEGLRLLRGEGSWREHWRPPVRRLSRMTVTFLAVFLVLLGIFDRLWVGYSTPIEHVQRVLSYGMALRRERGPAGIESYPWQWLWNDVPIPYLKVEQQIKVGDEIREQRPTILFLGAMNPYVLCLLPLGLGFAAYAWWRRLEGAQLAALALAWFALTYLPFVAATVFGQRIAYLFYFLPTLPAVALAGSYFFLGNRIPRVVILAYLAMVLFAFYGYFPFKPVG
jgi:predicted membrane-bound dolichyl-phosphate-mannose-protein mannosyltransferase